MNMFFLHVVILLFSYTVAAQQIGAGASPLLESRLGLEAGGYLNRGAGTGALVRYLQPLSKLSAFELAAGGATGDRGGRALANVRHMLVAEDVSFPALYLRGGLESYRDGESVRRNAVGGGVLLTQGFVLQGQEVYGYCHPRLQLGIESESNEFVIITGSSFGLNTTLLDEGRRWIGSVELDLGFQNAPNVVMVGLATDIE